MKVYGFLLFYICLNLAAFIINVSGALPVSQELYINPFDISNKFSLTIFLGVTVAGGLAGVIALITRQYVYASVALIIWVIGLFVPIGQWFLLGVPIMLNSILPVELSYIIHVITAFCTFIFFMFMVEIVTQRQLT